MPAHTLAIVTSAATRTVTVQCDDCDYRTEHRNGSTLHERYAAAQDSQSEHLLQTSDAIVVLPTPAHECEHCYRGFRTDCETRVHYSDDDLSDQQVSDCENSVAPCAHHACYWAHTDDTDAQCEVCGDWHDTDAPHSMSAEDMDALTMTQADLDYVADAVERVQAERIDAATATPLAWHEWIDTDNTVRTMGDTTPIADDGDKRAESAYITTAARARAGARAQVEAERAYVTVNASPNETSVPADSPVLAMDVARYGGRVRNAGSVTATIVFPDVLSAASWAHQWNVAHRVTLAQTKWSSFADETIVTYSY